MKSMMAWTKGDNFRNPVAEGSDISTKNNNNTTSTT